MTAQLEDLIARLEAAQEGNRELDARIWAAVEGKGQPFVTVGPPTYDPPRYFCNPHPEINWIGYDLLHMARYYTTSLDAALTLVPDDWTCWELGSRANKMQFRAELSRLEHATAQEEFVWARAPTAPLALCIAALKARAANEK